MQTLYNLFYSISRFIDPLKSSHGLLWDLRNKSKSIFFKLRQYASHTVCWSHDTGIFRQFLECLSDELWCVGEKNVTVRWTEFTPWGCTDSCSLLCFTDALEWIITNVLVTRGQAGLQPHLLCARQELLVSMKWLCCVAERGLVTVYNDLSVGCSLLALVPDQSHRHLIFLAHIKLVSHKNTPGLVRWQWHVKTAHWFVQFWAQTGGRAVVSLHRSCHSTQFTHLLVSVIFIFVISEPKC